MTLGNSDTLGSIGFSQVQNRYWYGSGERMDELDGMNPGLLHENVIGLIAYSMEQRPGGGLRSAFVEGSWAMSVDYPVNVYPHMGLPENVDYEGSNRDLLAKALSAFHTGASVPLYVTHAWPQILQAANPNVAGLRRDGVRYAIEILDRAGVADAEWLWSYDDATRDPCCFTYSEDDAYADVSVAEKRASSCGACP